MIKTLSICLLLLLLRRFYSACFRTAYINHRFSNDIDSVRGTWVLPHNAVRLYQDIGEARYVNTLINSALPDEYLVDTWLAPVIGKLSIESLLAISASRPDISTDPAIYDAMKSKLNYLKPGNRLTIQFCGELVKLAIGRKGPKILGRECSTRAANYYDHYLKDILISVIHTYPSADSLCASLENCFL